ncbi:activity-regulated cytoskeleton associated protein 2-like [Tribolium madens]|uniref:activity-regulated cytoskeleton associated protein 2-like n=1 Tax=Tribolium madens TaxID=41895 RepID=UPI001CF7354B|nr:activity-regulated cytoskeleton associated protein 2-like [Tribolium madens]
MAITAEAVQELIRNVQIPPQTKHFTHCPARFNGTRSAEAVNDFIASTGFYKETEDIKDENALRGLPLLLEGPAHTWWTGVKNTVNTWEEAKDLIRNEFAPRPPVYKIYQKIFSEPQDVDTPTGLFVFEKRALLAQIHPPDSEARQIDFIYGLLRHEIRDRTTRSSITSFSQLLQISREIEESIRERSDDNKSQLSTAQKGKENRKTAGRCEFCRAFGHSIAVCRKKEKQEKLKPGNSAQTANTVQCYGCGKPGVIRRNCENCNQKPAPDTGF